MYHNENDKYCCGVLRKQFQNDIVDDRSIKDVNPEEIKEYKQCHFFAGIGGFSLGFKRAGLGASINVYTGGFPCQDLSVAGKRKGLAGERSGLWFEFHRIIEVNRPGWVVIENVPGLLSSNKGQDFAVLLQGLAELGYGVAWRVLDSQYFGVAQRRRRVFIVGSLGSGRAAEVLFEREGGAWDPAPSREKGKEIARSVTTRPGSSHREDRDTYVAATLTSQMQGQPNQWAPWNEADNLQPVAFNARRTEIGAIGDLSPTLNPGGGGSQSPGVAFQQNTRDEVRLMGGDGEIAGALPAQPGMKQQNYIAMALNSKNNRLDAESQTLVPTAWEMSHADDPVRESGDIAPTLQKRMGTGGNQVPMVGVRRLTPTECERLQGFPDGHTEGQSDTQRYRQLGNAVTVNVAEWIGKRIIASEKNSI